MSVPRKPKPKHIETVCDICGLDWKRHGKAPTTDKCIELLKADLAKAEARTIPYRPAMPQPYPVPYPYPQPVPYPRPVSPWPYTQPLPHWTAIQTTSGTSGTQAIGATSYTVKAVSH